MNLSKAVKIVRVMNAVAAGTDDVQTGTHVDMQGFDGVMFVATFGTLTATAVTKMHIEQGALVADTDMADLAGTEVAIDAGANNKMLVSDIYRPTERYVRPIITRATANAVIDGVYALLYGPRTLPIDNDVSVAVSELHVSPLEGTV